MCNYRNFKLVAYFVAQATVHITREELEKQLAFNTYDLFKVEFLKALSERRFI